MADAEDALAQVFREEWPKLIGAAFRIVGDLQAAEDAVQDSLVTALDRWPLQGLPDRPGAWLMTVCRNRARNLVRDAGREQQRSESLRRLPPDQPGPDADQPQIADDRLRLIVMCCHPLLPADAQIALTLRMVAGLTTEEIARAFHLPATAIAQRIVRAKRTLRQHGVAFAADDVDVRDRLGSVLDVIYLAFNEGYLPGSGQTVTREDLAREAHRLACMLTEFAPDETDTWSLRALLSFQLSRWATRAGPDGALLTLEAQDRDQWDRALIADGISALARARCGGRSALLLQAQLAACHATASSFAATDWKAIVKLYEELTSMQASPVVALNRAVAVAMADGPEAALPLLDQLADDPSLRDSHRVWAVRADLHQRAGHAEAAIADYDVAIGLADNQAERRYLEESRSRAARACAEYIPPKNTGKKG
jgi:RNA polymerase sigma factor (sigma-70 family)